MSKDTIIFVILNLRDYGFLGVLMIYIDAIEFDLFSKAN